jgi:predicted nuclease of predicted toxin-antitoxin system
MGVRLFIDECLSPRLARAINAGGRHMAIHPLDHGGRGQRDDEVLARAIREDLIIVTENARDFRKLIGRTDLHPGLIIMPNLGLARAQALLDQAMAFLQERDDPMRVMVNHVLEVGADGDMRLYAMPET